MVTWAIAAAALLALVGGARGETITAGNFRVTFAGSLEPRVLPRKRPAAISISVRARVAPIGTATPPALHRFTIAFNRHARVSLRGLPWCPLRDLRGATTSEVRASCSRAVVGGGRFSAHIDVPDDPPFPSLGRVLAVISRIRGRPVLIAHVYGKRPVPTAAVLPLLVGHGSRAPYGVTVSAEIPQIGNEWGYVTGFTLRLGRTYRRRGRQRAVVSASCPAPLGTRVVPFRLALGTFYLSDGEVRERLLIGHCRAAAESATRNFAKLQPPDYTASRWPYFLSGRAQLLWRNSGPTSAPPGALAEADLEPTPTFPGKQTQAPLLALDLSAAQIAADPKARTVSVSGASLALSATLAADFNELFAKPQGKADVFHAGEAFGVASFTAKTQ